MKGAWSRTIRVVGFCLVLVAPTLVSAKDKKQEEAAVLLARARELSDIRCEGCPPFRMKAGVRLPFAGKMVEQGRYELVWSSRDSWWDSLSLLGVRQMRVRVRDRVWQSRPSKVLPDRNFRTLQLLDFVERLRVFRAERVVEIMWQGQHALRCVHLGGKEALDRLLCFSERGFLGGEAFEGRFPRRFEFSGYGALGLKYYPHMMRIFEGQGRAVEIEVLDMRLDAEAESTAFLPPEGSEELAACDDFEPARPRNRHLTNMADKIGHKTPFGSIAVFSVIEPDGSVSPIGVVRSLSPELDSLAMDAVRQWKFFPASCGGAPVRQELVLEVENYPGFWGSPIIDIHRNP